MGFKLTGRSGLRRAKATPRSSRLQGLAAGRDGGIVRDHSRPAFLPDSPQEQGMDSPEGPRFQGLEAKLK